MEKPRLRERKGDRSCSKKAQTGAEEKSQRVACLCKHEDLNSNPQHHAKKSSETVSPSAVNWRRQENRWASLDLTPLAHLITVWEK